MRPAVTRRTKPSSEAEQQYKADAALAGRRAEFLDAAREAEGRFRQAQARRAPDAEVRRLAEDFDTALTEAMRAAYAAQRAEIGPRGYDDRIYRRKARATPKVHALTAEAERLLTLRETHRLNDIPAVSYDRLPSSDGDAAGSPGAPEARERSARIQILRFRGEPAGRRRRLHL